MGNITPVFSGTITEGKLNLDSKEIFNRYLRSMSGRVYVSVKRQTINRSHKQNAYYWGCVVAMISENLGYDKDETHNAMKAKFLGTEQIVFAGEKNWIQKLFKQDAREKLIRIRSTATLTTSEFSVYVEGIVRWAAEFLSLIIPKPEEVEI